MSNDNTNCNVAIEELKVLQEVIARHEQHSFRVKGWLFAIMAALTAALFTGHLKSSGGLFFVIFLMILTFAVWLAYHRMIVHFAANRVKLIESQLRMPDEFILYDGPKIYESLTTDTRGKRMLVFWQQWKTPEVWLPSLVAIACIGIGLLSSSAIVAESDTERFLPVPPNPAIDVATMAITGHILICAILIIAGGILVFAGKGGLVKAVGVASLIAGGGLHFVLAKDVKIESFLKGNIDPTFNFPAKQISAPSDLIPQYLGGIEKFKTGFSSIDENDFDTKQNYVDAVKNLDTICKKWLSSAEAEKNLTLIVGSTDRVRLGSSTRSRYEANTGLARARAEAVREYLFNNCPQPKASKLDDPGRVLVLVSGPRHTPSIEEKDSSAQMTGFPEDRRVDVWMFSATAHPAESVDSVTDAAAAKNR